MIIYKPPCVCDTRKGVKCSRKGCGLALPEEAADRCHICWLYHKNLYGHKELWDRQFAQFFEAGFQDEKIVACDHKSFVAGCECCVFCQKFPEWAFLYGKSNTKKEGLTEKTLVRCIYHGEDIRDWTGKASTRECVLG